MSSTENPCWFSEVGGAGRIKNKLYVSHSTYLALIPSLEGQLPCKAWFMFLCQCNVVATSSTESPAGSSRKLHVASTHCNVNIKDFDLWTVVLGSVAISGNSKENMQRRSLSNRFVDI